MADGKSVSVPLWIRTSDLKVRTLSALVMLALAGGALWAGGWFWTGFVLAVVAGTMWEWARLVRLFAGKTLPGLLWLAGGAFYIGVAGSFLHLLRFQPFGGLPVLVIVGVVVATDVGAYFAGRSIGGPKIAPRISPSKTWAGLCGGVVAASLLCLYAFTQIFTPDGPIGFTVLLALLAGTVGAVVAQIGDFFESWMKRRAHVKDSSHLIPGHGGVFDRVDGLLAVCFVLGLLQLGFGF